MFKMLNRRIKTDNLTIETYNKSQIMRLIPFADSDALRKLILLAKDDDMKLEIDEIVKTEQWKKAQEIHCDFHVFNLNVNDICHFSRITLTMKTIPAKDFEILRNVGKFKFKLFYNSKYFRLLSVLPNSSMHFSS
ncbi:hypothetical protein L5515_009227 [Caenorhabditis briggsae]|uniref:DUF38 domain-containing protein n=1 Tax=Caenorhabditis briggsae TaxID=6238 RepID=A0AAE9JNN7_CAEBR|nr:hypothetical protein L5515_009227 [Caenorhabditis briggsae]